MNVLFCRHGETVFNVQDKFQGVSDSPLTTNGVLQAEALNQFLTMHFVPDQVLMSPLPRVKSTIQIGLKNLQPAISVRQDLKEICYGNWEAVDKAELKLLPAWQVRMQDRYHFVHPGEFEGLPGESYAQLYQRLLPLFSKLEQLGNEQVVVCTHIGVLRCVLKYFEHLSDEQTGALEISQLDLLLVTGQQSVERKTLLVPKGVA